MYSAIEKAGFSDETHFMVITDHGGTIDNNGRGSHGGWSDEEKYATFTAKGNNVKAGEIAEMNIRDLAAIVLYALGIEIPEFDEKGWTSQVPQNNFDDVNLPSYRDISHLTGATPRISKTHHKSELLLLFATLQIKFL